MGEKQKIKPDIIETNLQDIENLLAIKEFGIGNSPETRQVLRLFKVVLTEIQNLKKEIYGRK